MIQAGYWRITYPNHAERLQRMAQAVAARAKMGRAPHHNSKPLELQPR